MVQHSFTSTETRRLVRMDSPGRPPRLSHSSWTMSGPEILCLSVTTFCCSWLGYQRSRGDHHYQPGGGHSDYSSATRAGGSGHPDAWWILSAAGSAVYSGWRFHIHNLQCAQSFSLRRFPWCSMIIVIYCWRGWLGVKKKKSISVLCSTGLALVLSKLCHFNLMHCYRNEITDTRNVHGKSPCTCMHTPTHTRIDWQEHRFRMTEAFLINARLYNLCPHSLSHLSFIVSVLRSTHLELS